MVIVDEPKRKDTPSLSVRNLGLVVIRVVAVSMNLEARSSVNVQTNNLVNELKALP